MHVLRGECRARRHRLLGEERRRTFLSLTPATPPHHPADGAGTEVFAEDAEELLA